jgi:hypothetical protein
MSLKEPTTVSQMLRCGPIAPVAPGIRDRAHRNAPFSALVDIASELNRRVFSSQAEQYNSRMGN